MGVSWSTGNPPGNITPGGVAPIVGSQPPNVVNLPAELYPPQFATGFFFSDAAAIVGVNVATTFPNFNASLPKLPPNMVGVVDQLTLLIDGILITTVVQFSLLINNAVVPGFNNLVILPRNGATFVTMGLGPFLRISVPVGGVVTAQAVDVDGGAYTVGIQARGWFWPSAQ